MIFSSQRQCSLLLKFKLLYFCTLNVSFRLSNGMKKKEIGILQLLIGLHSLWELYSNTFLFNLPSRCLVTYFHQSLNVIHIGCEIMLTRISEMWMVNKRKSRPKNIEDVLNENGIFILQLLWIFNFFFTVNNCFQLKIPISWTLLFLNSMEISTRFYRDIFLNYEIHENAKPIIILNISFIQKKNRNNVNKNNSK